MKRMMMMVALAAFLVAALSVSALSAFAASPDAEECAAGGGTYSKDSGQFKCVYPPVASNPGDPTSDNAAKPFKTVKTDQQTGSGGGGGEAQSGSSDTSNRGGHTF